MEELGGETQPLAAPQRVAGVEADRAILPGSRGFSARRAAGWSGAWYGCCANLPRHVAHGRIVEGHCLLCPRATPSAAMIGRSAPCSRISRRCITSPLNRNGGAVSPADWGEIMPFKLS